VPIPAEMSMVREREVLVLVVVVRVTVVRERVWWRRRRRFGPRNETYLLGRSDGRNEQETESGGGPKVHGDG
jgi:hypothetical protein